MDDSHGSTHAAGSPEITAPQHFARGLNFPAFYPLTRNRLRMHFDLILKRLDDSLKPDLGHLYQVWLGDEILVTSRDPEFAAFRALAKSGRLGRARFWREGRAEHDISMHIATAAKWRVKETARKGLHFVKFEEFPAERVGARANQLTPASVPYGRRMPRRILTPSPARLTPQAISPPGLGQA